LGKEILGGVKHSVWQIDPGQSKDHKTFGWLEPNITSGSV
jgi:hypothetical protein